MKLPYLNSQLHVHSTYSLIDAVSSPEEIVKYCVEKQGTEYIALTDHGMMGGLFHLEQACAKYNAKPIVAIEAYVDLKPDLDATGHLTMFAYNDIGKKNLLTLFYKSWDNLSKAKWGKKKPQMTWELLEQYKEGIFVGTGCLTSVVSRCLLKDRPDLAEKNLDKLIEIYGKDNVFAEFVPHAVSVEWDHKTREWKKNECTDFARDGDINKAYLQWLWREGVEKRKLKPVTTTDAHMTSPDKKPIQDSYLMNGEGGWHFFQTYSILEPEEIYSNLSHLPGFNQKTYIEMAENAKFFTHKIGYAKQDKELHLAFKFNSQEESLAAFADNVLEDRLNKVCDCHGK